MAPRELIGTGGQRWRIRRHWVDRPRLEFARWRKPNSEDAGSVLDLTPDAMADDLGGFVVACVAAIAFAVVVLVAVFVLLPAIGLLLEVLLLLLVLSSGLVGRIFLRRPWIVKVENLDEPSRSRDYAVVGWLRSRRAMRDLRQSILATGAPGDVSGARLVTEASG